MGEKKPVRKNSTEMSPILRRPSMERSHIRLGIHVPPPTPPRTVSVPHHKNVTQTLVEQGWHKFNVNICYVLKEVE